MAAMVAMALTAVMVQTVPTGLAEAFSPITPRWPGLAG
jgi:hypothetical protein